MNPNEPFELGTPPDQPSDNEAPLALQILAVIAAALVIVIVARVAPSGRGIVGVYCAPILGAAMNVFPNVFEVWSAGEFELPHGLVRIGGWILIALPLLVLLV